MNLQTILNSKQAGMLALFLSRHIPPSVGYRLAHQVALRIVSSPQTPVVQAIRANQWVVSGGLLSASQLDEAVLESLEHVARAFFQFFRYLNEPSKLEDLVVFNQRALELISRNQKSDRGLVVCGVHSSSFDLVVRTAALKFPHILALSLPEANDAIEWQHKIRSQVGLEILPATLANIRQLVHRLESGEMVLTGIDHPVPDLKYHPIFFGRPAQLPTHHIFLAQKARVPIVLLAAIRQADGRYHVVSSDYIEMEKCDDRSDEMTVNAERVLQAAEALIRLAPHQWTVFQPLWPQVLEEVPSYSD
jgi:phosphatidylinositol dimannoside acyltransferase